MKLIDKDFEKLSNDFLKELDLLFKEAFGLRGEGFQQLYNVPQIIIDIVTNYIVALRDDFEVKKHETH